MTLYSANYYNALLCSVPTPTYIPTPPPPKHMYIYIYTHVLGSNGFPCFSSSQPRVMPLAEGPGEKGGARKGASGGGGGGRLQRAFVYVHAMRTTDLSIYMHNVLGMFMFMK